jgi:membrane protein DedA with SNARE-associated domain
MFNSSVAQLIAAAGHHPLIEALAIIFGTFILEDAATVLAAAQVQRHGMPLALALVALYIGIVLGDLGLYGLGRLAALVPWAHRLIPPSATRGSQAWLTGRLSRVVFISRFLPGARLPVYTACGFLGASLWRFAATAVVATLLWTTLLFSLSLSVGDVLAGVLGAWRWAGMGVFAVVIVAIGRAAARLQTADR